MLDFDELNLLVKQEMQDGGDVVRLVTGLITMGYHARYNEVDKKLNPNKTDDSVDYLMFERELYKEIDGETYIDRLEKHIADNDAEGITRVLDTEYHRMSNVGGFHAAERSGKVVYKQWVTMDDDRVRSTHDYINEVSIPLEDKFFTYDGDYALYPGNFTKAENNVNCRCWLDFKSEGTL